MYYFVDASDFDQIMSSSAAAVQVSNPSAVYAVVSRNRTVPAQTDAATVSSGRGSLAAVGRSAADAGIVDARRDLYTQVVRRSDGPRSSPSSTRAVSEPSGGSSVTAVSADGYARIDDAAQQPPQLNYNNNSSVDFYDVIRDDLSVAASSDFDPSYESVPPTTVGLSANLASSSVNCVAGSSRNDTSVSRHHQRGGTATSAANDLVGRGQQNDPPVRNHGFLVREHIYDEVSLPTTRRTRNVSHTDV